MCLSLHFFFASTDPSNLKYAKFWDSPSTASIMWLGVLFGVFGLSSLLARLDQHKNLNNMSPSAVFDERVQTYRTMMIHCLVAGDYLKPRQNTMEALTLHLAIDQIVNVEGTISNWVLMGVIARLALRMGLHRDPSHWPSIRPLHAEMRRRLWISYYQMDFYTSAQLGLARIIKDAQCDTKPPMHLDSPDTDQDFLLSFQQANGTGSDRPVAPTPLLFVIQRNSIVQVAAAIYDATEEQSPPSRDVLAAFELQLNSAIALIPAAFIYTSFDDSIADGPLVTLHRIVLDTLIQKTVYLLHRRSFVRHSRSGNTNIANDVFVSQDKCIHAALSILKHQERLAKETSPGGHLYSMRWKVAASLDNEILQAAMMLCFALSASSTDIQEETRDDISNALARVKLQWEKRLSISEEPKKALRTIAAVLQRYRKDFSTEIRLQHRAATVQPSTIDGMSLQHSAACPS